MEQLLPSIHADILVTQSLRLLVGQLHSNFSA